MSSGAAQALACPVCRQALQQEAGSLRCSSGHSFDIARQGYINLLTSAKHAKNADTAEMVDARASFLGTGAFDAIADEINRLIEEFGRSSGTLVVADAGAGTGHHLGRVIAAHPGAEGIALDISKYAARRSSRLPGVTSVVADTWERLPLRDGSVDVLLNVFSPRNAQEFARVLRTDGILIVVSPYHDHLAPLVDMLGLIGQQPDKQSRVTGALAEGFRLLAERELSYEVGLDPEQAFDAAMMGPSALHVERDAVRTRLRDCATSQVQVRVHVQVGAYRRI